MKKRYIILLSVGVIAIGAFAAYHLVNTAPADLETPQARMTEIMDDGKCLMCHSEGAQMPFYANFPIVSSMMKTNIENGLKRVDLTDAMQQLENGGVVDKATLNKLEYVIDNDLMPLPEFNIIHWGAAVTSAKQKMAQEWIAKHRSENYYNGLAAAQFANEPVQPIPAAPKVDSAKYALGVQLFHDTRLSSDNTVSCASCHLLDQGGVDGKQFSEGVQGKLGGVNAPTVYNAVFNKVQFWDGRAETLALQAAGPPLNPIEMASESWEQIIGKLQADKAFTSRFASVYPQGYSEQTITDAIAEFEKTLVTPDCAFDKYLKGDLTAINDSQKRGYDLFKANRCATCHVGVNMGGQSFEYMGLMNDYFTDRAMPLGEEDNGRFKETKLEKDRHRFKVPTLRNVALTAPYLHDGTVAALPEVLDKMMHYQLDAKLTPTENEDMVAFLESLTGEIPVQKI